MDADTAIQTLISALTSSAIYILVAIGFTLVFGVMRIVNFAHGAAYTAGAYGMYILATKSGLPYVAALVLTVLVVTVVAAGIELALVERTASDGLKTMILTLGISLLITGTIEVLFGASPVSVTPVVSGSVPVGSTFIPKDRVVVVLCAVVVLGLLWAFLKFGKWGQALRAVSQDPEMAAAQGVRVRWVRALGFGGAAGLAALAATLIAPVLFSTPYIGDDALVKSFMIVIIGGVGSVPGVVLAGLLVGFIESVATVVWGSSMAGIITFSVVILVLLAMPNGLLGRSSARV